MSDPFNPCAFLIYFIHAIFLYVCQTIGQAIMRAVDIFIAYSHNDLGHKNELKKFLRPLINTGQARVWDDYEIEGGQDWEAEIKKRLYGADIILLLVSPDSLASDYFYGQEVTVSLQRHDKGEAAVIPVILRPCTWTLTPLKRLEALPEKGRPVTSWASQDEAYTDIAHAIGSIVESRQAVIAAASLLDDQRRNFSAAAEAAEHLFYKKQWEAAQKAFASALQMHQSGFSPERAALESRINACAAEIQSAAQTAALDARRKEYESLLDAAEYTAEPKQLAQILQNAIQLYQPGFPGNVEDLRQRLQAARTIPRPAPGYETQTDSGGATGSNKRFLLPATVAVVLLLLALFAYRQCSSRNNKPGKTETEQPQRETPTTRWQTATTIPALQDWLNKNPKADAKDRADANQRLESLRNKRRDDLKDINTYLNSKEYRDAEKVMHEVLQISPDDEEVMRLRKRLPKQ